MNPLNKVLFFLTPNPLARKPNANRLAHAFSRYFRFRRSRFGVSKLLRWYWHGKNYDFELKEEPHYQLSSRVTDFGDQIAIEESFSTKIYSFDQVPEDIELVVDLGAHIGCFSLLAEQYLKNARKVCIEPDSENFKMLERNLQQNSVEAQCFNVAVSDVEGQATMAGDVGIGKRLELSNEESATTDVCRLSRLIDFSEFNSLLLKCDTEGSEFKILDDILDLLPEKVFMFIEVHEGDSSVFRLRYILEPLGFEIQETHGKGLARDCIAVRGCSWKPTPQETKQEALG